MTENQNRENTPEWYETPREFLHYLAKHKQYPPLDRDGFTRLEDAMTNEDVLETYALIGDASEAGLERTRTLCERWYPRPKMLYHASSEDDLQTIEPRQEKVRHKDEPPQIFAAPSEQIASMFIADIENMTSGSYDGRTWVLVVGDEKRFREQDHGGFLYQVPPQTFSTNPNRGLGLFEWQSREHVQPLAKKHFPSAIDAMLENGVRVYFLPPEEYAAFENAQNQKEILDSKQPYKK